MKSEEKFTYRKFYASIGIILSSVCFVLVICILWPEEDSSNESPSKSKYRRDNSASTNDSDGNGVGGYEDPKNLENSSDSNNDSISSSQEETTTTQFYDAQVFYREKITDEPKNETQECDEQTKNVRKSQLENGRDLLRLNLRRQHSLDSNITFGQINNQNQLINVPLQGNPQMSEESVLNNTHSVHSEHSRTEREAIKPPMTPLSADLTHQGSFEEQKVRGSKSNNTRLHDTQAQTRNINSSQSQSQLKVANQRNIATTKRTQKIPERTLQDGAGNEQNVNEDASKKVTASKKRLVGVQSFQTFPVLSFLEELKQSINNKSKNFSEKRPGSFLGVNDGSVLSSKPETTPLSVKETKTNKKREYPVQGSKKLTSGSRKTTSASKENTPSSKLPRGNSDQIPPKNPDLKRRPIKPAAHSTISGFQI